MLNLALNRSKGPKKKHKNNYWGYLFCLPALVFFALFILIPTVKTFGMAFYDWDLMSPEMTFVGLDNFQKLFNDPNFAMVLGNTFFFTIIAVVLKVGLGILLANFVASHVKGRVGKFIMESSLFLPIVIPMSIVAMVFGKLYDTEFGALNALIVALGGTPVGWLTEADKALGSIIVLDLFKGIGFFFIISLTAIRNIPKSYYEAAEIDGANRFYQFTKITIPLMGNTIVLLFVNAFLSSFQIFDPIYILLNGMFGDTKITISYMMWQQAFFYRDVGYASVISIVIFLIAISVTLIQLFLSKKLVHNEAE